MKNLEALKKLVIEELAIQKSEHRLRRRKSKLATALKEYRGDLVRFEDGSVYCVNEHEYPSIMFMGELIEEE